MPDYHARLDNVLATQELVGSTNEGAESVAYGSASGYGSNNKHAHYFDRSGITDEAATTTTSTRTKMINFFVNIR